MQVIESDGRFRIYDQTAANEYLTISNAGNVGIGTTNPTSTLTVDGTINGVGIKAGETDFIDSILISGNGATGTLSSATSNTGFGSRVLANLTSGASNVAVGRSALGILTTGGNNTAVGRNALKNSTASNNVAVGFSALSTNTTGAFNTAVGRSAGASITTGSNNVCIGYQADTASATSTNSITLGDANITSLRCNTQTISALSDARDKANVEDLQLGVEFIKDLRPVSFTWDRRDNTHNGVEDFGFIAQELDAVQEKHNEAERLGLVLKDNPERLEASYGKLVPMLVKAIQEQQEQIEFLKEEIANLKGE
jgi:hypothetical protein